MNKTAASLDYSSSEAAALERNSKFRLYDFRVPKKFTKDDMKLLVRVTDTFSKLMSASVSALTREPCSVYNPKIDEISSAEYIDKMPTNTMIGILCFSIADSDLKDPRVMFHLPSELGFFLIDVLLGGTGKPFELDRQHTDIEVALLKNLISKFCGLLDESWQIITKAEFTYEKSETNSKFIDVKSADDVKVVMSFDVNLKNIQSKISIAYSAQFLEDLMGRAEKQNDEMVEVQETQRDLQRKKMIFDSLGETNLELKAVFSELNLDMQDIAALSVGDVITLDKKITDEIKVYVDDEPWFYGKLGQTNIKKAVKLTDMINSSNNNQQ